MNRNFRRFNRTHNMNRETSHKTDPTPPSNSISTADSWTTHDSNLALFECLSKPTPTRPALPTELILQILNHPTRWILLSSISLKRSVDPDKPIVVIRGKPTGEPLLLTSPFSARQVRLLRNVIFTFRSRDQGWSSQPDQGRWSWFEASLAQPSTDENGQGQESSATEPTGSDGYIREEMERHNRQMENQPRYKIQTNRHASGDPEEYTIELTDSHELVQRVQEGDKVVLWACACFLKWENRVYDAEISVMGMDDLTM